LSAHAVTNSVVRASYQGVCRAVISMPTAIATSVVAVMDFQRSRSSGRIERNSTPQSSGLNVGRCG
jgi:hypothetical protein